MPFLWKKKNRTRISQLVADFQSPKRTSSLVVQTGFPTSLIDLFVKNRNRFKKNRSKKPVHSEITDLFPSPPPPPPPSPITSPPSISESPIHEASSEEVEVPMQNHPTGEINAAVDFVPVNEFGSNSKMITVKMLTVIILAASVKDLTVAITVSAFALLFLENSLKRVVTVKSMFLKILFQSKVNRVCEPVTVLSGGEVELSNLDLDLDSNCCVNDEIEVVEEKSEVGICCEELENSLKIRGKGNRSGRFKATMVKKLQKFRGSKKEKKEEKENININNSIKENEGEFGSVVVGGEEKEEIRIKNEVRDDCGNNLRGAFDCGNSDSGNNSRGAFGCGYSDCGKSCSRESNVVVGNSSYAILVMVVLVGLIVGRLQALILTIGWCFMVKIVRGLWRSKNVGFNKGCVTRCS